MSRLLASILVAFALFLSPVSMGMGGGAAVAHSTTAQTEGATIEGECAGMHQSPGDQNPDVKRSCAAACAALPGTAADVRDRSIPLKSVNAVPAEQVLTGIRLEGETPPPRSAPEI